MKHEKLKLKIYEAEDLRVQGYHFHNEYEMIFITKGSAEFEIDGKKTIYHENCLIFLNQYENHSMLPLGSAYERYVMIIDPDYYNRLMGNQALISVFKSRPKGFCNGIYVDKKHTASIKDALNHCIAELNGSKICSEQAVNAHFLLMMTEFYRNHQNNFPSAGANHQAKAMARVQDFLDKHFLEDLTLETLAKAFHLNKFHLARVFHEVTGYTIKQYILLKRISHAKNLLYYGNLSISQIADESGFNSTNNFIRAFKNSENITPGKFRKKFSEGDGV